MILTDLTVDVDELEVRTGWDLKPEGLCRADMCIPLPEQPADGPLDAEVLAERLGAPLLHDEQAGLWALGPATLGKALDSAELPPIVLPDVRTGELFELMSLHGRRILLIAWASW